MTGEILSRIHSFNSIPTTPVYTVQDGTSNDFLAMSPVSIVPERQFILPLMTHDVQVSLEDSAGSRRNS
jgi:hypothetical protein